MGDIGPQVSYKSLSKPKGHSVLDYIQKQFCSQCSETIMCG